MTSAALAAVTICSFGTRHTAFRPVTLEVLAPVKGNFDLFHCLCFQNEFEHFSPEELRLADYEIGPAFAGTPTSGPALPNRFPALMPHTLAVTDGAHHGQSGTSNVDESFVQTREGDDIFTQTREDGLQLLLSEIDKSSHVRLPPLSGFDEFTIRRLYSPVVAEMVRIHPKLVSWIGESATAMIESLASKENTFEEDIEKQIADLKIEVMKARLGEARAKQLRQEAIRELNIIKKETGAMPQTPSATIKEQVINAAHTSSTRQLPENMSMDFAERYSTNIYKTHPFDSTGNTNPIPPAASAVTLRSSSAFASLPARPETSVGEFPTSFSHRDGLFAPYPEAQAFGKSGTSSMNLGSGSAALSSQPSSVLFPFPSYPNKLGEAVTLKLAQYVSPYAPLHPTTASTEAFNRGKLFSGAPGSTAFAKSLSTSSLALGPYAHDSVRRRDAVANTSQSNISPNPVPTSTLLEPAQKPTRCKRHQEGRPRTDSYRPAKKARSDRMVKREDGQQ
jgi:hypothetical protein